MEAISSEKPALKAGMAQQQFTYQGGTQIDEDCDEYNELRYHLEVSTNGRYKINSFDLWKVENVDSALNFGRKYKDLLKVSTWLKSSDLGFENNIENITKRGIVFPKQSSGMKISTGRIDLKSSVRSKPFDVQLIYCDVAVGRAFVADDKDLDDLIPRGYDSYYSPGKELDRDGDGNFGIEEYMAAAQFDGRMASDYKHTYYIKNSKQVIPRYVVRASVTELSAYDDNDTNEMNEAETKNIPIPEFFDAATFKPAYPQTERGNSANFTQYVTLEKAFENAVNNSESVDDILGDKKEILESTLSSLDERVRKINMNYAECYEAITNAQERAIEELEAMTRRKLTDLLSLEIELRRQQEELAYLGNYADMQIEKAKQYSSSEREKILNFLTKWRSHITLRNRVAKARPTEMGVLSTIVPDMRVLNSIEVVSGKADDSVPQPQTSSEPVKEDKSSNLDDSVFLSPGFAEKIKDASNKKLFAMPAMARDELVPMWHQKTIDHYSEKVQQAIDEILESKDTILPYSISKPAITGAEYDSKGILKSFNGIPGNSVFFDSNKDSYDHAIKQLRQTKGDTKKKNKNAKEDRAKSPSRKEMATSPMRPRANANSKLDNAVNVNKAQTSANPRNNQARDAPQRSDKFDMSMVTSARKIETIRPQMGQQESYQKMQSQSSVPTSEQKDEHTTSKTQTADVNTLLEQTEHYKAFSLVTFAERKIEQLGPQIQYVQPKMVFPNSIVFNEMEAQTLYYALPFFTKAPVCSLIFSTEIHRRGLDEIYKRCAHSRTPNIIAIRAGEFVLGVYLSHPLHLTGEWSGSPSCFVFSSTLGLKFSYHGRVTPDKDFDDGTLGPAGFFADLDQLLIGNGDLAINNDLRLGVSNLEHCYGIGLDKDSNEAKVLLAGAPNFQIDAMEVWGIA